MKERQDRARYRAGLEFRVQSSEFREFRVQSLRESHPREIFDFFERGIYTKPRYIYNFCILKRTALSWPKSRNLLPPSEQRIQCTALRN